MESSAVPNAIAAALLHVRDLTGQRPLNSARFLGQMSCLVDHAAAAA
jgi:hypothetical protein